MRLSEIKTMEDLEAAQRSVASRLREKGDDVMDSVRYLRQEYSFSNMFRNGLDYVSDIIPVRRLMLLAVERLIRIVKRRH